MHFFRIVLFAVVLALVALPCAAKIYKYQKDGVWYYTDSPPREKVIESETMVESGKTIPPPKPGGTLLLKDYPRRSAIEMATAATVAVKGGLGYGSGFFISTDGYILTNKHVIRTTEKQHQGEKKASDVVAGRIEDLEKKFADEKKQMAGYAADLKQLKHLADSERDRARKKSYKNEYAYRLKRYATWKADYKKRHQKFLSEERTYRSQRADYNYKKSVANLSQSFAIILADNTELNVRLVATSADHDLALLKLDGYKTPALKKVDAHALIPGGALFAIGNPARLTNSVTSGVFSGYEQGFIQTNAQIYPGNSGGPLVTGNGRVVGINTFKKITHKFEGLGFAIPIQRAFQEFGRYLR
jgi:serine protease Do